MAVDFDEAIKAHSDWKMKLNSYIRKPDRSLKPTEVCQDNRCTLGKWIYGEGAKYASLPTFTKLKTEHGKFHRAAANVVTKVDSGQSVSEEVALGSSSEFATASKAVVSAIMAMKAAAK